MSENKVASKSALEWARQQREQASEGEVELTEAEAAYARRDEHEEALRRLDAPGNRTRLSVLTFEKIFLPMFLGEEVPQEITRGAPQPTIGTWVTLAGRAYNYVNLVDDRTGEVVLVVPPVLDNEVLGHGFHEAAAAMTTAIPSSAEIRARNPEQARSYLTHLYEHELNRLIVKPFDLKFIAMWNKIFAYFDKPLIEIPGFDLEQFARDKGIDYSTPGEPNAPAVEKNPAASFFNDNNELDEG